MTEPRNPEKPVEGDRPEDPLDDLLHAAFEPDPLEASCRHDSVLAILKTMTGSENKIRLRDLSESFTSPAQASSVESHPDGGTAGRYKVLGEIARGGLGIVMRGQDNVLGRDVALKMLQERFAFNPMMIRRLFEEAQIGGQLQHPGIVPIYEMGLQENQQPFFTMKLVKGHTLSALLKGRKDPGEDRMRFLRIFEQICQTMAYAHARGVIHRDLKPSNIMVGSFGEAQLMDWGLAKVVGQRGARDDQGEEEISHDDSSVETYRTATGDRYSEAGSVMGTYGYMAPEQARGEGDQVGESSDVFGLGAILCVILTGKPPFVAEDPEAIRRMAQEGKLDECWKRLEESGTDLKMKDLAKRCLAAESDMRPRNAGVVAEEMETYLAEVAERAHRAELQSAENRVRAEEAEARARHERKAKRLGYVLAAAVVLAVVSGMIGYYWIESSRRQRIERTTTAVNEILSQAELLRDRARTTGHRDLAAWSGALEKGREAVRLVNTTEVATGLMERVGTFIGELEREEGLARKDYEMLQRLENIRVQAGESWDWKSMDSDYAAAFRWYGMDLDRMDIDAAVSLITDSAIRREVLGELDEWILALGESGGDHSKLARIVQAVDTDAWRNELRLAWLGGDGETVRRLAGSRDPDSLLPVDVHVLSIALTQANASSAAVSLLEAAVRNHPNDFLLNFHLGWTLSWSDRERLKDAIRYLGTAVALRPESPAALNNMGLALRRDGQFDAARSAIKISLAHDADHPRTLCCHGVFLYEVDHDYDAAIFALERSVELDPLDGGAHASLGRAWHLKGDLDQAMKEYRRALELSPDYIDPKGNLALILDERGDKNGALRLLDEILQVHPDHGLMHYNRGGILNSMGRKVQAAEAYREAVRCNPEDAHWHYCLGSALFRLKKWGEAKRSLMKVIELDKENREAHYTLGCTYWRLGHLHSAKDHLIRALEISPDYIEARLDLGNVYHEEGKLKKARTCLEEVLERDAEDERALYNLGNVHLALGDYDEALGLYQRQAAISDDCWAWNNIGWIYKEMGELENALQAFRRALAGDADFLLAQYNLAVVLLELGEYEEALDAAQQVIGVAPDDRMGEILTLIGDIRIRQGSLQKAEDRLREAIRCDWNADEPRFKLANLLYELGRYSEAIELFEETVEMSPDHQDAYIDLAFSYRACGRFYDALIAMHRGHEIGRFHAGWDHSSDLWVKECMAMIEINLQLESYLEGTLTADTPEHQTLLALVCMARGYPGAAVGFFRGALSTQPGLGNDVYQAYWFQAARAAIVASTGMRRNDEEIIQLRQLALHWLKKDLAILEKIAESENMGNFTIQRALAVRKLHPDLYAVRDPDSLASLPNDEGSAFEEYWDRVEELQSYNYD